MVRVTEGSSFSTGLLSMPSIAWLRILWLRLETFSMFAEGKGAEEGKEDRGEVRRVILIGGVSGDVLLKRSQVVSVLVLKSEKHVGYQTVVPKHTFFFFNRMTFLHFGRKSFCIDALCISVIMKISWEKCHSDNSHRRACYNCKSLLLIASFNYSAIRYSSVIFEPQPECRQSPFQLQSIQYQWTLHAVNRWWNLYVWFIRHGRLSSRNLFIEALMNSHA